MAKGPKGVLLIEHYVAPSPIHGFGTYSAVFVSKGEKVWEFHPAINRIIPASDFEGLPRHVLASIESRAEYLEEQGAFLTSLDGDQFTNHSDEPNTVKRGSEWFAAQDIYPGEELTCDYRQTLVLGYDPATGLPFKQPQISVS